MGNEDYQITPIEMTVTLVAMLVGVGILTLPRVLAVTVGTSDGWISMILGATFVVIIVYLIVRLNKSLQGKTVISYVQTNLIGKLFGKGLAIFYVSYFLLLLAYEARILIIVVRLYLLDRTPSEVTMLLIFATTTYAISKGLQGVVHLCLLLTPIVFFVILFLLFFNIQGANFAVVFPIAAEGFSPIIQGVKETVLSFLGIEILFFLQVYMKQSDQKALSFNIGILIVAITYICTTVLAYAILTVEASKKIVFPLVALAKEVEIIEGVIERYEPVMITLWIVTIFNTMAIAHFIVSKLIQEEYFKKVKRTTIAIFVGFLSYIIAFIPDSIQETFGLGDYVSYLGFLLILSMLVIGYATLFFDKKSIKNRNEIN